MTPYFVSAAETLLQEKVQSTYVVTRNSVHLIRKILSVFRGRKGLCSIVVGFEGFLNYTDCQKEFCSVHLEY